MQNEVGKRTRRAACLRREGAGGSHGRARIGGRHHRSWRHPDNYRIEVTCFGNPRLAPATRPHASPVRPYQLYQYNANHYQSSSPIEILPRFRLTIAEIALPVYLRHRLLQEPTLRFQFRLLYRPCCSHRRRHPNAVRRHSFAQPRSSEVFRWRPLDCKPPWPLELIATISVLACSSSATPAPDCPDPPRMTPRMQITVITQSHSSSHTWPPTRTHSFTRPRPAVLTPNANGICESRKMMWTMMGSTRSWTGIVFVFPDPLVFSQRYYALSQLSRLRRTHPSRPLSTWPISGPARRLESPDSFDRFDRFSVFF